MIYTPYSKRDMVQFAFDKILARRQRAAPFFKPRQAQDLLISRDNRIRKLAYMHRRSLSYGHKTRCTFQPDFF